MARSAGALDSCRFIGVIPPSFRNAAEIAGLGRRPAEVLLEWTLGPRADHPQRFFRIPQAAVETELAVLWRREMVGGAYAPRWVTAATDQGSVRAITFTRARVSAISSGVK